MRAPVTPSTRSGPPLTAGIMDLFQGFADRHVEVINLGHSIDWHDAIAWASDRLGSAASVGGFAPLDVVLALEMGFDPAADLHSVFQLATRFKHGGTEAPFPVHLNFFKTLTRPLERGRLEKRSMGVIFRPQ